MKRWRIWLLMILVVSACSKIKPYAWWTFAKGRETDRMGRR
jgi:hypothetical protein